MKKLVSFNLLTSALIVTLIVGCTTQLPAKKYNRNGSDITAPNKKKKSELNVTYTAPKDWAESETKGNTIYTAPEGDTVIVFAPNVTADDVQGAAATAWSQYDETFSRRIRLSTSQPADQGWDKINAISYETSPTEEKVVDALVYKTGEQWKVLLIHGNLGTIAKRQAAMLGMIKSFAVQGHVTENLSRSSAIELTPELVKELIDFVSTSAKELDVPGVGIGLIQNGKVVFEGGIGVKSLGSNDPVEKDTLFMVASNTKGMTTLLLAKLVELGKLKWDDRVIDHYPSFKLGDQKTTESVLIQHLVCACTGLPRKDLEWVFNSGPNKAASITFSDLATTMPTSGFGELFQYNNQMAAAAGYVAGSILYPEMEIGAAYDKAMQEYIFDPLKMNQTMFSIKEAIQGNYAKPHALNVHDETRIVEQTADRGFNHMVVPYRPAGAAWSTPHDMLKYIQNELSEGVAPDGTRLFASDPLLKRREPVVSMGKKSFYGMGLMKRSIRGIETVMHGGSLSGYKSQIAIIPEANIGAVILTNSDSGDGILGPFIQRLIEILYNAESKAEEQIIASKDLVQKHRERFRADLIIPPGADVVSELAAQYNSDELGSLTIRKQGDQVILDSGFWSTPIATKNNNDGTTSIVMTNPSLLGVEAIIEKSNGIRGLKIITPQHKYIFTEVVN